MALNVRAIRVSGFYAAVAISIAACLVVALRLWEKPLRVPFAYEGDSLFWMAVVKASSEDGWAGHFRRLGMPFGVDYADFPSGMPFDLTVLRVLVAVTGEAGAALNLYWLGSIVATGVAAAYGFSVLGLARAAAFVLGGAFALLPYAFYRNVAHFPLVFHFVPLIGLLCLKLAEGDDDFGPGPRRWALLACCLQGLSIVYYSLFSCALLVVAGGLGWLRRRRTATLRLTALAVALTALATAASVAPSWLYWRQHGPNLDLQYKAVADADTYGLKLRHLLIPIGEHPLPAFRQLAASAYLARFPGDNENTASKLGTVASLGFLILLALALGRIAGAFLEPPRLLPAAAALTLGALLLAQVGGFGSLFNLLVAPDVRGYDRMVVFIAFFSLAAAGSVAQALALRSRWSLPPAATGVAAAIVLVLVAFDQIPSSYLTARYPSDTERFREERAFVERVESLLPAGAMVFQLPHTLFPVEDATAPMVNYDQARPYVHSRSLRWSWGAVAGRNGNWSSGLAKLRPEELVPRLALAGFSGVWVDRFGYGDRALELESSLAEATGDAGVASANGRWAFYAFPGLASSLTAEWGAEHADRARRLLLAPIDQRWDEGFLYLHGTGRHTHRLCGPTGRLVLTNPLDIERHVELRSRIAAVAGEGRLTVLGEGWQETHDVTPDDRALRHKLVLGPKQSQSIGFAFVQGPGPRPPDPRDPVFMILDFSINEDF